MLFIHLSPNQSGVIGAYATLSEVGGKRGNYVCNKYEPLVREANNHVGTCEGRCGKSSTRLHNAASSYCGR